MDELEISGKRYISTRRAGKEHKYHSDYIGQLIRGGKVKGQKVGRSWYVDEVSLATYLGKEVPKSEPKELLVEEKIDEIVEVEMPIRATTWKRIPEVSRVEVVGETTLLPTPAETLAEEIAPEAEDATFGEVAEEEKENHITIRNSAGEEKKKNITYVANDAPVFPVKVRKQNISMPVSALADQEEIVADEASNDAVVDTEKKSRNLLPLQYGAVAMLGVLAFILVGGMSYLLSYKTTVEGDQMSASITLTK